MTDRIDISQVLLQAMGQYGELVLAGSDEASLLKKGSVTESIKCGEISFQKLKEAGLKLGDLLEADSKKGIITVVVPVGAMRASRALLVASLGKGSVDVAAFFKEGLIKQNGAKQAIESLKHQLQ